MSVLSSSKFFAEPVNGNVEFCLESGMNLKDIQGIKDILQSYVYMYSIMIMHCSAMRIGLGYNQRLVVKE